MSIEASPFHSTLNDQNLRVITLHSSLKNELRDQVLLHNRRLPLGPMKPRESFEAAALRIVQDQFDFDHMTTVAHLHHESGVSAHVVEAAYRAKSDLRKSFAARAFDLSYFSKGNGLEEYDPIDVDLIRTFANAAFRR